MATPRAKGDHVQLEWSHRDEKGEFRTYDITWFGERPRLYGFEVRGPGHRLEVDPSEVETLLATVQDIPPIPRSDRKAGPLEGYYIYWRRAERWGILEWRLGQLPADAPPMHWHERATEWARAHLARAPDVDRSLEVAALEKDRPEDLEAMVPVFRYIEAFDAFELHPVYEAIADYLGLADWSPVVWIGRLFTLDEDYGEHWFDNWDEREAIAARARALGYDDDRLFVIDPARFVGGRNGPCHDHAQRKRFWTDVLRSLRLSHATLFREALSRNGRYDDLFEEDRIDDLPARIEAIQRGEYPIAEHLEAFRRSGRHAADQTSR